MFDSIPFTNLSGKFLKLWKYFFDEILITVFVTKLFKYKWACRSRKREQNLTPVLEVMLSFCWAIRSWSVFSRPEISSLGWVTFIFKRHSRRKARTCLGRECTFHARAIGWCLCESVVVVERFAWNKSNPYFILACKVLYTVA